MKYRGQQIGFTLVEVVVVMGLVAILITIVTGTLFQSRSAASVSTTALQVINDAHEQQMNAMLGATASAGVYPDYSIYFTPNSYTLFAGDTYTATNPSNVLVTLDPPLTFTNISFPSNTLTFLRLSGDVSAYQTGHTSVTLTDSETGDSHTLMVNRRGIFIKGL